MTQPAQLSTWPGFDRTHHSMLTEDNSVPRARPWTISKSFTKASRPELVPWSIFFVASGNFKTHMGHISTWVTWGAPIVSNPCRRQDRGLSYGESFQTLTGETVFSDQGALAKLCNPCVSTWERLGEQGNPKNGWFLVQNT